MYKFVFIANNNVGSGLSGGDRIFLEFLRHWQDKCDITIFASQETLILLKRYGINKIRIITTDCQLNDSNTLSILQLIKHNFRRTFIGINTVLKHQNIINKADYLYSVSDFYPDLFPAFVSKLLNKRLNWIAGYYLFAPNPFSKDNPYKGKLFLKGLFYWLMQIPSYFMAKNFADIIFVTSEPDIFKFPKKKVIVIRGGVDTNPSELFFKKNIKSKKNTQPYTSVVFILKRELWNFWIFGK